MDSTLNIWIRRIWRVALLGVFLVLLVPASARFLAPLFGLAAWGGAVFGYICIVLGIPFLLSTVGRAGYNTVLKPYVRARRIRVIRNQRLLREAVERQVSEES